MRSLFLTIGLSLLTSLLVGQSDIWTLERAVQYASENNLQISQIRTQSQLAALSLQQNRLNRLPTLNAGGNLGYQLGRTIDPTTNTFVQQNILFNGFQAQANILLYNGGQIRNGIRQAELEAQSAELLIDATTNDISLQIANAYLNVLLIREQLDNAVSQLALVDGQLEQTDQLIQSGAAAPAQRLDLVAQQAAAQRSVVELRNQVENSLLLLQQLMQMDYDPDFDVITPELEINEVELSRQYSFEEVYLAAQQTQPDLRIAELNAQSAEVATDVARAGFYPTVSFFASLSTNYSDVARDFANPDRTNAMIIQTPPTPVIINGESATLSGFQETGVVYPNKSYGDQLNENFGQSLGLNLNIPIYSQGRNKINVQRAQLNRRQSEIQLTQSRVDLQNEVLQALNNLNSAQEVYRAAQISLEAAEAAYAQAQRRYELGAANALDLLTATNRLEQARIERTRSKYQLIFNQQVIRFYLGDRLSLN